MAKSDALKIAQIEERRELERGVFELAKSIISHPIPLAVGAFYLSDRLQGEYYYSEPVLREYKGVPTWVTEKQWHPQGGKLNQGAAIALQTGLIAYLGSDVIKTGLELIKP